MENNAIMSPEKKKVTTFMSSDGRIFPVEDAVIMEFRAIHDLLPVAGDSAIPIPQITGDILAKIIDYCRKHIDHKLNPLRDQDISAWDRDFLDVENKVLVDLFVASHLLQVKDLYKLTMVTIVDKMMKKSPAESGNDIDQLRNIFMSNLRL